MMIVCHGSTRKIRQFLYGPSPGILADRRLVKFCKQVIVAKKAELSSLSLNANGVEVSSSHSNGDSAPKTGRTSLIESLMRASSGVFVEKSIIFQRQEFQYTCSNYSYHT